MVGFLVSGQKLPIPYTTNRDSFDQPSNKIKEIGIESYLQMMKL